MERIRDWPGVHSAAALLDGEPLKGYWFDRTREYAARNQREEHDRLRFASEESVVLSPLPCWAHLTPAENPDPAIAANVIIGLPL